MMKLRGNRIEVGTPDEYAILITHPAVEAGWYNPARRDGELICGSPAAAKRALIHCIGKIES